MPAIALAHITPDERALVDQVLADKGFPALDQLPDKRAEELAFGVLDAVVRAELLQDAQVELAGATMQTHERLTDAQESAPLRRERA